MDRIWLDGQDMARQTRYRWTNKIQVIANFLHDLILHLCKIEKISRRRADKYDMGRKTIYGWTDIMQADSLDLVSMLIFCLLTGNQQPNSWLLVVTLRQSFWEFLTWFLIA
jgi:hypothetical protein